MQSGQVWRGTELLLETIGSQQDITMYKLIHVKGSILNWTLCALGQK
jgi:hypothetical protein